MDIKEVKKNMRIKNKPATREGNQLGYILPEKQLKKIFQDQLIDFANLVSKIALVVMAITAGVMYIF